jgi:hypothetical protein
MHNVALGQQQFSQISVLISRKPGKGNERGFMDNELLYAKIEALEGKRPLARRRPRR